MAKCKICSKEFHKLDGEIEVCPTCSESLRKDIENKPQQQFVEGDAFFDINKYKA